MTPKRTRYLAALGGGAATVALVVAAIAGYNALQPDESSEPVTVIETTTPEDASPTATGDRPDEDSTEPSSPASETEGSPLDEADGSSREDAPPADEKTDEPMPAPDEPTEQATPPPKSQREPESDDVVPAAGRVLHGFARDFKASGGPMAAWHLRMSQWLTPALWRAYETVDRRQLPNTRLERVRVQSASSTAVTAVISYHSLQPFWIVIRPTTDGWRVTRVEPWEAGLSVL